VLTLMQLDFIAQAGSRGRGLAHHHPAPPAETLGTLLVLVTCRSAT